MLSTMHSHPEIGITSDQNPSIILFYKKIKSRVHTLDKFVRSYSTKCMTQKWHSLSTIIDVSAINAFVIWKGINYVNATSA